MAFSFRVLMFNSAAAAGQSAHSQVRQNTSFRAIEPRVRRLGTSLANFLSVEKQRAGAGLIDQARKDLATHLDKGDDRSLRQLRLAAGLTQQDLALHLGTSQAYIAKLESGKIHNPGSLRLRELAKQLSTDVVVILRAIDANKS